MATKEVSAKFVKKAQELCERLGIRGGIGWEQSILAEALRDIANEVRKEDYGIAYAYARDYSDSAAMIAEKIGDDIKDRALHE